jgi:hypothetical protein
MNRQSSGKELEVSKLCNCLLALWLRASSYIFLVVSLPPRRDVIRLLDAGLNSGEARAAGPAPRSVLRSLQYPLFRVRAPGPTHHGALSLPGPVKFHVRVILRRFADRGSSLIPSSPSGSGRLPPATGHRDRDCDSDCQAGTLWQALGSAGVRVRLGVCATPGEPPLGQAPDGALAT